MHTHTHTCRRREEEEEHSHQERENKTYESQTELAVETSLTLMFSGSSLKAPQKVCPLVLSLFLPLHSVLIHNFTLIVTARHSAFRHAHTHTHTCRRRGGEEEHSHQEREKKTNQCKTVSSILMEVRFESQAELIVETSPTLMFSGSSLKGYVTPRYLMFVTTLVHK